jgi:hypothetical protein
MMFSCNYFLPSDRTKLTLASKYRIALYLAMTAIMSLNPGASLGTETLEPANGFSTGQSWGALRKAWKGYRIAKVQADNARMTEYATKIRKIQGELGITRSTFPNLGIA